MKLRKSSELIGLIIKTHRRLEEPAGQQSKEYLSWRNKDFGSHHMEK